MSIRKIILLIILLFADIEIVNRLLTDYSSRSMPPVFFGLIDPIVFKNLSYCAEIKRFYKQYLFFLLNLLKSYIFFYNKNHKLCNNYLDSTKKIQSPYTYRSQFHLYVLELLSFFHFNENHRKVVYFFTGIQDYKINNTYRKQKHIPLKLLFLRLVYLVKLT